MLAVPLQSVPSQQTKVVLNNQNCQISVYLKGTHIYVDLNADGVDTFIGAIARNAVLLNPCQYAAFSGDLMFIDTQRDADPTYDGLGTRYQLIYFTEDEIALILSK